MSNDHSHFRGESFGTPGHMEHSADDYLQTLITHYKTCLILEKSGKTPDELLQHVRSIEREISLLDSWNAHMEEILEIKDLDIDRLTEDIQDLDEDLQAIELQRQEMEIKLEKLQDQKLAKDKIIQKQEFFLKEKDLVSSQQVARTLTPSKTERKLTPNKNTKNRYESPSLV